MVSGVLDTWPYVNCFTFDRAEEKKCFQMVLVDTNGPSWTLKQHESYNTNWQKKENL